MANPRYPGQSKKSKLVTKDHSAGTKRAKAPSLSAKQRRTLGERAKRLQQTEMLLHLSRTIAGMDSLDEILATIVEMVTRELKAERGSLFLNDSETGELYSRFAQGTFHREIRFLNTSGIAGHTFTTGESLLVHDAYANEYFESSIDQKTGFKTQSICCSPIRSVKGEILGVVQCLNKKNGQFTQADMDLLQTMATQAAFTLQTAQYIGRRKIKQEQEMKFLNMVSDITSELELGALLQRVMNEATRMLNADRSTLFLLH